MSERPFKPGDRVWVTDPGLAELRRIMRSAGHVPLPNHIGTVEDPHWGDHHQVLIVFDNEDGPGQGAGAPYPTSHVHHLPEPSDPVYRLWPWQGGADGACSRCGYWPSDLPAETTSTLTDKETPVADVDPRLTALMEDCGRALYDDREWNAPVYDEQGDIVGGNGANPFEAAFALDAVAQILGIEGPTAVHDRLCESEACPAHELVEGGGDDWRWRR